MFTTRHNSSDDVYAGDGTWSQLIFPTTVPHPTSTAKSVVQKLQRHMQRLRFLQLVCRACVHTAFRFDVR